MVVEKALESIERQLKVIWMAMLGSVAMYCIVGAVAAHQVTIDTDINTELLLWVFYGVAASLALFSFLIPSMLLSDSAIRRVALSADAKREREQDEEVRQLPDLEFQIVSAARMYLPARIVAWGMCDGIGVLGLVLAFITGDQQKIIPFAVIAIALHLSLAPRLTAFVDRVRTIQIRTAG